MKTWLGHYNGPQLIGCLLFLLYVVPGLIFVGWGWGKFKCPRCGALDKSVAAFGTGSERYDFSERRAERDCPFCGERILKKAVVCKHCQRDVEPLPEGGTNDSDGTHLKGL